VLGLDKEALTALRPVGHDPTHATPRLRTQGEDVTPVADRDVPLAEAPLALRILEGALELGGEPPPPLADLAAQETEPGASVVRDCAVHVERPAESTGELGEAG